MYANYCSKFGLLPPRCAHPHFLLNIAKSVFLRSWLGSAGFAGLIMENELAALEVIAGTMGAAPTPFPFPPDPRGSGHRDLPPVWRGV